MSSRDLVHPELVPFLDLVPKMDLRTENLPELRRAMNAARPLHAPMAQGISVEELRIPGPNGAPDVRVLMYRPASAIEPLPAFLHIHGGCYVVGTPEMAGVRNASLAADLECVVVSVDYRLSPETPFPGALEDCYAALVWMYANAEQLGIDRERIAIGGESAGGGLAAALGLYARDRNEVPVAFQLLIYPMLDDRTAAQSDADRNPYTGEYFVTPEDNRLGWHALLGREPGSNDVSPYASAARALDVSGLPPTFISVGALDLFLEENVEFARRLMRAGVPTELHVYPGAFHAFDVFPGTHIKAIFERDYLDALRAALRQPVLR